MVDAPILRNITLVDTPGTVCEWLSLCCRLNYIPYFQRIVRCRYGGEGRRGGGCCDNSYGVGNYLLLKRFIRFFAAELIGSIAHPSLQFVACGGTPSVVLQPPRIDICMRFLLSALRLIIQRYYCMARRCFRVEQGCFFGGSVQ